MRNDILCIVPVRAGSKSLRYKNIRPLGGRPLLYYPIRCALSSKLITRTIVTTEDAAFASLAKLFGAEVPFLRPVELAQDSTTDLPVFKHALNWLREEEGYQPELVVQLRATAPIRDTAKVDEAIELMIAHPEADSLRSVREANFSPYKMWRAAGLELKPLINYPEVKDAYDQPRQALPQVFQQDGFIDIIRPRTLFELDSMAGKTIFGFHAHGGSLDIDHADDLRRAGYQLPTPSPVDSRLGILQGRLMPSRSGELQSFPGEEWEKEFFLAAALTFSHIEVLWEKKPTPCNPLYSVEGRSKLREAAEASGVRIGALCDDTFITRSIWSELDGARAHLHEVLMCCSQIGCPLMVLPLLEASAPGECPSSEALGILIREVMELSRIRGVELAFELALPAVKIAEIEKIAGCRLPICFDTGNLVPLGLDVASEYRILASQVRHLHLKDKKRSGENVQLGTGEADLAKVVAQFGGYSGRFTFETSRGSDPVLTADTNLRFIREHMHA
jgi:CMP-N,N'-diacetyllegionaminic acid synthase